MNSIGLAIAVVCGNTAGLLVLGRYPAGLDPLYGWALLSLAATALLPALLARDSPRVMWTSLLVAFGLLGFGRALLQHPPVTPADLAYYNSPAPPSPQGPIVRVRGVVATEPLFSDRAQTLRISATTIAIRDATHSVSGDMYAVVPPYPQLQAGQTVQLSGVMTAPPTFADFDYASYLARQGVFSYMSFPSVATLNTPEQGTIFTYIIRQRTAARRTLESVVAEPQASIAVGVVTGDRTSISDAVQQAFRDSGTTHILAISGENISLMAGFLWLIFGGGPVKRRLPWGVALSVIVLIVTYSLFTGASASVVRAAIMAVLLLIAPLVGRRYDPIAALAVSAAVMLLFDPNLLADGGFLLSFGSMLGIAIISPHLHRLFTLMRIPAFISIPIATSLGATLATLPLLALLGGHLSIVGPLATLTADFALPPLIFAGIATVILGPLGTQVAAIPALLVWISAGWLLQSARFWSSLPFATIDAGNITFAHLLLYYTILLSLLALFSRPKRWPPIPMAVMAAMARSTAAILLLSLLAVVAVVVWAAAFYLLFT